MAPQSLLQAFQQELDKENFRTGVCKVEVGFFRTLEPHAQEPTEVKTIYLDVCKLNDLTSIFPDWEFNFEVWSIIKANIGFLSEEGCSSVNGWARIKIAPKG
jgi:hypothetical protein